jgi:hypothetical protein
MLYWPNITSKYLIIKPNIINTKEMLKNIILNLVLINLYGVMM